MKKLLFIIENLGEGGAERVLSLLANELVHRDYSVDIALLQTDAKVVYEVDKQVRLLRIGLPEPDISDRQIVIRTAKRLRFKKLLEYERRRTALRILDTSRTAPLRHLLSSGQYDAAISFLVKPNIALVRAARGLPVKVIISERNYPLRDDYPLALTQIKKRSYGKRFDACVAQTEEILRLLGKRAASRGVVIQNPINDSLPVSDCSERKHIVTNYCTFKPQKNLPLLINAFSVFSKEFPDYRLEIYGRGDRSALDKLILDLRLTDKVSILPFDPDLHEKIKDYAMFVSASDFEGISNSMIEAMAVGIPAISTDCDGGGARAIISDHENGILVPKNDIDRLVAAMKEIAGDPALSAKLSVNARRIREQYSLNSIITKWIDLIETA